MRKIVLLIIILSFASKILGFLRDLFITGYLGFGSQTDAILMAILIPTLIFSVFQTSFRTTFAPLFSFNYHNDKVKTNIEFNKLKNVILLILIILSFILFLNSEMVVKMLAPGFTGEVYYMTVKYFKVTVILVITYGIFNIITAYLQALRIFSTVETAGIFNNISIITSIYFFWDSIGPIIILYGYILGSLLQIIVSYFTLKFKTNYKFKLGINYDNEIFLKYWNLAKYVITGGLLAQVIAFSDKFFGSLLSSGSITALYYADIVKNLPITIIILTVSNVLFPNLSILSKKNKEMFFSLVEKQLIYMTLFSFFISSIFLFYNYEIIKILFYRNQFTLLGVEMTSSALFAYSLGIVFWAFKEVLSKVSYAQENTKIPLVITINSLLINLLLNYVLGKLWGHFGIALATSISYMVNSFIFYFLLYRKGLFKLTDATKAKIFKILYISLLLFFPLFFVVKTLLEFITNNSFVILITGSIFILISYLSFAKSFGITFKKSNII